MVRLIPVDETYFEMLSGLAGHLVSASALLEQLAREPARRGELVRSIRAAELAADELSHAITLRLGRSFVPPFDAGDIFELATSLDGTIDIIEESAQRIVAFEMETVDEATQRLAGLAARSAAIVAAAVDRLPRPGSVMEGIGEAWRLEEEGDAIYTSAVTALFAGGHDALAVLKCKELYDLMETALDRTKVVAAVIVSIALKLG